MLEFLFFNHILCVNPRLFYYVFMKKRFHTNIFIMISIKKKNISRNTYNTYIKHVTFLCILDNKIYKSSPISLIIIERAPTHA